MNNENILYQHGTLALLVPGLLDGTITMGELLAHGDTRIGTGEGLDGELIILDGIPYQVNSKGEVNLVKDDFTLPFATTHFANFEPFIDVSNSNLDDFEKTIIAKAHASNTFFAVITKGNFSAIKTRAVVKAQKPYPTLVESADMQTVFEANNVSGTLLTYYSPQVFHGVSVGGCHSHFLSDDHSIGGHVLNFNLDYGQAKIQKLDTLVQHLPTESLDYMEHDFTKDSIQSDINKAEK